MSKHLDSTSLKLHNVNLVKKALRKQNQGTKQDIAYETGLSIASCTTILNELIQSNEINELELAAPNGGRPARRFEYNKDFKRILLVGLAKEDKDEIIHLYVCNLIGEIESKTIIHKQIDIDTITEAIESQIAQYPNIAYLSIGIPGVTQNGQVYSCDLELLEDFKLSHYLEQKFELKVVVENDVNAIAVGYYNNIEFENTPESIVYIYYPSKGDPGAGIIVNGKVIHGAYNIAGEIKYMDANDNRKITQRIIKTINNFNYILNPQYFVVSGLEITSKDQQYIISILSGSEQKTKVLFEENIHDHYLLGLKYKAFEML